MTHAFSTLRAVSLAAVCLIAATARGEAASVDYLRDVKPIFARRCYACHGALQQNGGLRLDTAAAIKRGGDSGPALTAGDPAGSLLVQAITGDAGFRMPPEGEGEQVSATDLNLIRAWIAAGAVAPDDEPPQPDPRAWWSYQPPRRPAIPPLRNSQSAIHNPLDAFLAAEQEKHGLTPNLPAAPEVRLRRVYLDLIGLPPTREELHAFLADPSPLAYERVVDDLLARPQYGERWGRHWMDVWRYSDWYGRRENREIRYSQRHIWRWRDWIVESLNADKGYDRMVAEMLAGDELAPTDPDTLRATGFLGRNWYKFNRNVWMFDTIEQTGQAFLALTFRCCRCHDHKYDPISQEDYYRFRAFFEPHDVRTDPLSAFTETENDATLGAVLKDGVARVYDKTLDAPTYVFRRGDDRYPIEDHPLTPAVPPALCASPIAIKPIALPVEAYYPALRPTLVAESQQKAVQAVEQARAALAVSRVKAQTASEQAAAFAAANPDPGADVPAWLADNFSVPRPDVWQALNGQWQYENGRLVQSQVANFATMVTQAEHPQDFRVRLKYRTLAPGSYRSVGFSFDFLDKGQSQDVYTSTGDAVQSVQAFHRVGGQQVYPPAGIVKTSLRVGEETVLEAEVRGSNLVIWLNGERKLDYVMPTPRRPGKFALWVHSGATEFLEIELRALTPNLADLRRAHRMAAHDVARQEKQVTLAEAEAESLHARLAAERAKYAAPPDPQAASLALAAGKAERRVKLIQAEIVALAAEQHAALLREFGDNATTPQTPAAEATPSSALAEAEKKLANARQKLAAAREALDKDDSVYTPLGEIHPQTSTGRRAALAAWITRPDNPRTARVAVNHIWLRHFGEALVPTVDNFGLNGRTPSHPELLDWLAVELVEHGWSMKHLHRLIVTSAAYQQSSHAESPSSIPQSAVRNPHSIDPSNRFLWRTHSHRMEAEVVRDAALHAARLLDLTLGGPEFAETDGEKVFRRSLYFRTTPNARMAMLDLFDAADPNGCYRRRESVTPQQALAMSNSDLLFTCARTLAARLSEQTGAGNAAAPRAFILAAFETILTRLPSDEEIAACERFLARHAELLQKGNLTPFTTAAAPTQPPAVDPHLRARENLIHVLFSHNEFVTVR